MHYVLEEIFKLVLISNRRQIGDFDRVRCRSHDGGRCVRRRRRKALLRAARILHPC